MTDVLLQYLFPSTYIPLAGCLSAPVFWGVLIFYREEIGRVRSVVWGVAWIAVLLIFLGLRIRPAYYFPVQLLMAILIVMVGWYKAKTGR